MDSGRGKEFCLGKEIVLATAKIGYLPRYGRSEIVSTSCTRHFGVHLVRGIRLLGLAAEDEKELRSVALVDSR